MPVSKFNLKRPAIAPLFNELDKTNKNLLSVNEPAVTISAVPDNVSVTFFCQAISYYPIL